MFSAGEVLGADELNHAIGRAAYKTADENVTSSTAIQNDDHLLVAVNANTVYMLIAYLAWTSTSATPDFRLDFDVPSGASIPIRSFFGQPSTATTTTGSLDTGVNTSAAGDDIRGSLNGSMGGFILGTVVVGATAGNVQLRWAQGTSDAATVTLRQYSWLRLVPLS